MAIDIQFVRDLLHEDFKNVFEKPSSDDGGVFMVPFQTFQVVLQVNNQKDYVCAKLPGLVALKGGNKAAVLEKAMDLNYQLILGKYCYDPDDGELAFETTVPTNDFEAPWERYTTLIKRLIGVALHTGEGDGALLREMAYTGKWREQEEESEAASPYEGVCSPIRTGAVSLDDVAEEKRAELIDIVIEHAIQSGKDKVEDYPEEWQALIRERLDSGSDSGAEI